MNSLHLHAPLALSTALDQDKYPAESLLALLLGLVFMALHAPVIDLRHLFCNPIGW